MLVRYVEPTDKNYDAEDSGRVLVSANEAMMANGDVVCMTIHQLLALRAEIDRFIFTEVVVPRRARR